ncbi:aspartate racemase [Plesiomonas shigelloides]|uniref:aspartate/glutamate racemase family protein n=1 Tax=Plesiomonas shigelloides TaxID=703 RepID=UPI000D57F957|nr:amino acid racemase [Plesiomonas shigelloides]PVU67941.1 aspartate racemase [Plesiomonas shigelloides]
MQQQRARRLGILGGMGPLATVDFMRKIIQSTPAGQDQAHIPMVVANVPQIPDRTQAILDAAEDPFPALLQLLRQLEQAGATLFVIPCNTAHFWFKRLTYYSRIEAISIIDCVVGAIRRRGLRRVGLLATTATVRGGLYQQELRPLGIECVLPDALMQQKVMRGIAAVKAGDVALGQRCLFEAYQALREQGAESVILGCTEIPLALETHANAHPETVIDSLAELAQACVQWYQAPQLSELTPAQACVA